MPLLYRELRPPAAWAEWVECLWYLESKEAVNQYRVPPDGCLDIVYTPVLGLRAVGTMTVEQRFRFESGSHSAGIRFHPGMAGTLLRVAPAELTDRIVPLAEVWGRRAAELERRLDGTAGGSASLAILRDALAEPAGAPNTVQRAIAELVATEGTARLEWIARQANLSQRQFRRRCLEESGLTPKLLSRVLRFRRACRLAETAPRPDWARLACEAGYFDQAHLIRDFREFTGSTPVAVFSNPLDPPPATIGA